MSITAPPARTSAALAEAASTQPAANNHRGLTMSGRLSRAESSVPMTNPPCTAIVSQAVSADERWSSATIGAFAAVAENHTVMPRNMASDNHASCANGETPFNTKPSLSTRSPPSPLKIQSSPFGGYQSLTRQSLTPLTAGGRDDTPPGMSSLRKPNPGTVHPARYNPRASPTCRLRPAAGLASSSNDHTDEGVVNSPMFRTIQ